MGPTITGGLPQGLGGATHAGAQTVRQQTKLMQLWGEISSAPADWLYSESLTKSTKSNNNGGNYITVKLFSIDELEDEQK
jgi:hypothetical protein